MKIRELRILPPLAIGRLGSAPDPLESYTLEDDPDETLGFRRIQGAPTLVVDEKSGEITSSYVPDEVSFKQDGRFRPVAPFLEVFAVTDDGKLVPLTSELLEANGLRVKDLSWRVCVANRKVVRRTDDPNDLVSADSGWFSSHKARSLEGHCENFISPDAFIDFGTVRFIKPNADFPEIRLRFTPAKGLIYGTNTKKKDKYIQPENAIYDRKKGSWYKYLVPPIVDSGGPSDDGKLWNETLPPSLFAIDPPAPPWLHGNKAVSRGYLDDACDGIVEVKLEVEKGEELTAFARVTAGPPVLVPDSLFVRSLADDLDQALHGPAVPTDETPEQTMARAQDIIRRAYETVRFLNVSVMNGNEVQGRAALSLDTMPAEEAFDTDRLLRPVMAPESVDTQAILALHQQVYAALRGGAAPWFTRLLRRPEEAADYTDVGRRKMPALMCGADNNYLALTHRMIDTITRAADVPAFAGDLDPEGKKEKKAKAPKLTPRNLSAQLHYEATGNPISSRPVAAIANCCPGLEVDFRAVWRRLFDGIELREYDNLVVRVDEDAADPAIRMLKGHRLLRVNGIEMMTPMMGPSPASKTQAVVLSNEYNPHGLAPLEWSNALARILWDNAGKTVTCDFTAEPTWYQQKPWDEKNHITVEFQMRPFFDAETTVISRALAEPGELTQGLCSPWQNDYRECSCYYWASARPDFVNVEVTPDGRSAGDNWLQKERTGEYVPDDYIDERLILYNELFEKWEYWLRLQIRGQDSSGEASQA